VKKYLYNSLKLKFWYYIPLFCILANCNHHNPPQDVIKTWKVSQIKIGLPDISKNSEQIIWKEVDFVDDIFYDFKKDGTYTIYKNNQTDTGTWKLSADNKILLLFSELNERDNIEFLIEHFTDFNLTLSTNEKDNLEKIILIPQ
jgi:hypothetical protein